ncbi:MAG: hypothetical protein HETSPECPRED_003976 [Heterodermia speciosa]|uniref:Uncharacterized protein n=1 Tax=Heterodermia speciosa TaxID=116794 RepID=A0A8H3F8X2_9LECA|nr:MAG: hypothetical protein HETSPECPRED_003976 [Heterodermia speciosa]
MSLSQQISAGGLSCDSTFFPTLPAFTSRPQTLGLEHSKFAKFFLVQFSSPISPNLPQFSPISSNNLEYGSPCSDYYYPYFSPPTSSNSYHYSPAASPFTPAISVSYKMRPAPVALGMPNYVAFECEAVHTKDAVQETRFGKIHYSSIGLI